MRINKRGVNKMFQVKINGEGGYNISIGAGKIYSTRDIEEVKIALDHYYNKNGCRLGNNLSCPLCRAINEEMAKKNR